MKKTDITIVVDRSSSMSDMRSKAEEGVNAFIQQQREAGGECNVTIVDFSSAGTYRVVYSGPVQSAPYYALLPQGMTALNDAIGRAIEDTGARLRAIPEQDRPEIVLFNIMTDGGENDSREFAGAVGQRRVKNMIEHQTSKYSWIIDFMGAGLDVARQAFNYGIQPCNITVFAATGDAISAAYSANSSRLTDLRSGKIGRAQYTTVANVTSDGTVEDDESKRATV